MTQKKEKAILKITKKEDADYILIEVNWKSGLNYFIFILDNQKNQCLACDLYHST